MPVEVTRARATERLLRSLGDPHSRRMFLKGILGTGAVAAGATLLPLGASVASAAGPTALDVTILSIAATAEALAVTFYTNAINNAEQIGLRGTDLDNVKAFLIEEQIHHDFFVANGGTAVASTFSFPHGPATFQNMGNFLATQQQLEGAFDSAFIAACFEFASEGNPGLARIAMMVGMVEEGHRVLGREIGERMAAGGWQGQATMPFTITCHKVTPGIVPPGDGIPTSATSYRCVVQSSGSNPEPIGYNQYDPAEENVFAPQMLATVEDAPGVLTQAGYLSPSGDNSYTYQPVDFSSAALGPVYAKIMNQTPMVAS